MKVHTFTVATAAAAFLAASTMGTLAQPGFGTGSTGITTAPLIPAQYGGGRGGAGADGEIRCRTVVVPGSGRGPQQVCEQVVQQCRTVVTPGSGRGPQQVCG